MPTTDTMHSRRWAQLPDGRFVGGVRGGYVWTCKVADRWLEWDRRPLASLGRDGRKVGPSHFGSCFANVTVGWNQFALIYPYSAPGIELYLIAWDVDAFGRRGQSRS